MNHTKQLGIVVSHTHWDREWRTPVWTTRYHLMHFMDSLIDLLERNVDFAHMVLDGQTVMIQDYLEMAPHQKNRVSSLIKQGRIAIGPWYTLPDLFPVGGESLIRNLQKGMTMCREFGCTPTIAYTTFGWGQSAQMPQIYTGFGLHFVITAKYLSPDRVPHSEFLWKAPDGTALLSSRLGEDARANFFFNAYIPIRYGISYKSNDYRYRWGTSTVYKSAHPNRSDEDYKTLLGFGSYYPEQVKGGLQAAWDAYGATMVPDVRLLLTGSDATVAQHILPKILAESQESCFLLLHGSLETYEKLLREKLDLDQLQIVEGELRDGPEHAVTGNALAVRIPNKQLNARVEMLLTRIAEPLLVWASHIGSPVVHAENFLQRAWEYLLQSHCHDSINGVGLDKNSLDTTYRLRQAEELATVLTDSAIGEIIKKIDVSIFKDDDVLLFVYNPLSLPRKATIPISIDIPKKKWGWSVSLVDSEGTPFPVQIESREEYVSAIDDPDARPWPYDCHRIECLCTIDMLPSCGWNVFSVRVDESYTRDHIWPPPNIQDEISIGYANRLENQFLRVEVQQNGTISLKDKVHNKVYNDLLSLEDAGDVGDYWVHSPVYNEQTILSHAANVKIILGSNGPQQGEITIELELEIPAEASITHHGLSNEGKRSNHLTKLSICHTLTLRKTEPFLRIHTTIINNAKDHRLRFRFPLGFLAKQSASMSHFHLDQRSTDPSIIPGKTRGYWPNMQTYPMRHCVDVTDGSSSLAILTESFFEYEVESTEIESTLLLTAFRSVRNKICTESRMYTNHTKEAGGQLLETLEFEYALYPHENDLNGNSVLQVAETYLLDPLVYQFSGSSNGFLDTTHSMVSIDNPHVQLSAIYPQNEHTEMVVRVWNASEHPQMCTVHTYHPIRCATYTHLDGRKKGSITPEQDNSIIISLKPHEIATIVIGV